MTAQGAEAREGSPTIGSFADEAFAATAAAYAQAPGNWEAAVQSAIAGLFDFLAGRPAETSACLLTGPGAGVEPEALARRDRTIGRFVKLLGPGFAAATAPPPPVVAEAIGGGIYELIRGYARESRLEALPDAAPDAAVVALSPFQSTH